MVFADFSTGEVMATDILGEGADKKLASETAAYSPCEFFHAPGMDVPFLDELSYRYGAMLTEMPPEAAEESKAREADIERDGAIPQDAPATPFWLWAV